MKTRIQLFLLPLLIAIATPALHAAVPPSASFLSRPTIIPIEIVKSGHIAIRAMINGHGPYRFIFDTGAPTLLISERVGTDARIVPRDYKKPFFSPMGSLGEFTVKSILLGRSAGQKSLQAEIWNHPTVEELGRMFGRFEGLIGFPFFAHYQITIDYKARTMTLVPCVYIPDDTNKKMTNKLTQPGVAKVYLPSESIGIQVSKAAKDEAAGVVISTVLPGSPAEDAGVKTGDRLLTLDGRWTDSIEDCYSALTSVDTVRDVPAVILHDGKQTTVQVKVRPGI
jgi:hypothetical protein